MIEPTYKTSYLKKIFLQSIISVSISLLAVSTALPQQLKSDSVKTFKLNEVVVTGARYKTGLNKIPASITIIDQKQISQANDVNILPILGNNVPGLFLDSKNIAGYGVGPSAGGILTIRGIGGSPNSNILILIDGQPQFMGIFGHPIVDALNSSDIQRVEIIRGASSILYGTNAMGGAINIITKQPELNKVGVRASLRYGSYKTFGVNASAGYRNNLFGIFSSINNLNTDGSRTDAQDGFRTSAGYLKLSLTPKGAFSFIADGNISNSKFYDPGTIFSPTINNFYKYLRTRGSISAINKFSNVDGALRLFYSYGDHNFFNGWHSTDEMKGVTFYQNIKYSDDNIFTVGVDYKNYGGNGTQAGLPPFVAKGLGVYHSADETAVYGLINYSIVKPLNVEAGLRYTKNSISGSDLTPDFGMSYTINKSTVLKISAAKAFRSPTINELYLFPVANPNLKPEHVWNYEVSVDKYMMNNLLDVTLTAYYDKGDNFIVVSPPFNTNSNSGRFIHKGIEFGGRYIVSGNFNMSVNYAFLKCDSPTLYAPEHKINLHLNYSFSPVTISADLQQVSGLYTSVLDFNTESYFLLDANINYKIGDYVKLYVKGGNILNKNYQIDFGYPLPGRNIMLGINFER